MSFHIFFWENEKRIKVWGNFIFFFFPTALSLIVELTWDRLGIFVNVTRKGKQKKNFSIFFCIVIELWRKVHYFSSFFLSFTLANRSRYGFKIAAWNGATPKSVNCWRAAAHEIKLSPTRTIPIRTCQMQSSTGSRRCHRHRPCRRRTTVPIRHSRSSSSNCAWWDRPRRVIRQEVNRHLSIKSWRWKNRLTSSTRSMRWTQSRRWHSSKDIHRWDSFSTTSTTINRPMAAWKDSIIHTIRCTTMNTTRTDRVTVKKSMLRDFLNFRHNSLFFLI